jgi:iron complex transport system ATP-binding protein
MAGLIVSAQDVGYAYPRAPRDAVTDVSLEVRAGAVTILVGPNGCGKTTLLRLMLGVLRPDRGSVVLDGRPAHEWARRAFAQTVGVVTQREEPAFPMRVRDAVMHGRYARMGALAAPRRQDEDAVGQALARCDVDHLEDRWVDTLSGGEWQRVRIARALAQEPSILVLDEPTASLDVRHEMDVFELTVSLVRERGLGAVVVTHQVNLAARFADVLAVMHEGRLRAVGTPSDVLTSELVDAVFAWPMRIEHWRGIPQLMPLRKDEQA